MPVKKRKIPPPAGVTETEVKAYILGFLAKYRKGAEEALRQKMLGVEIDQTDKSVGEIRYWRNAVSVIKWLQAHAAADGLCVPASELEVKDCG